jgi:hypothetical protein
MAMHRKFFVTFAAVALASLAMALQTHGQEPIVVQVAQTPTTGQPAIVPQSAGNAANPDAETLKLLQAMKQTNDDTIAKQEATLKMLDDLQKAAEQLRIFSKRS